MARANVIRMAIQDEGREDEPRPRAPDGLHDTKFGGAIRPELSVPEVERLAKARAEDPRGLPRLAFPDLRRAARAHFTACEVHDSKRPSAPRERGERPAAPESDVVGMRRECEDVDGLDVHRAITWSPGSFQTSSRRSAPTTASRPKRRTYGNTEYTRSASIPPGKISSASRFTCCATCSSARPAAPAVFSTSFSNAKAVLSRVVSTAFSRAGSTARSAGFRPSRSRIAPSRTAVSRFRSACTLPVPFFLSIASGPSRTSVTEKPSLPSRRAVAGGMSATMGRGTITGGTIPAQAKSGQLWAQ